MEHLVIGNKYNKSAIMRDAWELFHHSSNLGIGECMRRVWACAKRTMARIIAGAKKNEVVRMHYGEYKNNYSDCRTVADSYDAATKTIEVFVNQKRNSRIWTKRNGRRIRIL